MFGIEIIDGIEFFISSLRGYYNMGIRYKNKLFSF